MCRSTSTTFRKVSRLNAADWTAIKKLDRLLERDIWIEWAAGQIAQWGPQPEILATWKNPSRRELASARVANGAGRVARSMVTSGLRLVEPLAGNVIGV